MKKIKGERKMKKLKYLILLPSLLITASSCVDEGDYTHLDWCVTTCQEKYAYKIMNKSKGYLSNYLDIQYACRLMCEKKINKKIVKEFKKEADLQSKIDAIIITLDRLERKKNENAEKTKKRR